MERFDRRRYTDEDLLAEFHRVATELGRVPNDRDLRRRARTSPSPFRVRFGKKGEVVRRYRRWLEQREPDSALLAMCDDELAAAARRSVRSTAARGDPRPGRRSAVSGGTGTVYGEPVAVGGLQNAPTNELGVVFLFGLMCRELGFAVQRIGSGFPDCEAMRAVDAGRTQWRRVRIEFEHRSRKFREHGHDPAGCDLVVCWRHDWPDCPVEVLELLKVVEERRR